MSGDTIYVHLESVSNLIWSDGITINDFVASLPEIPRHLLLLTPVNTEEQVDRATGFNVLATQEEILDYLMSKKNQQKKWIDFARGQYLKMMTPTEVSELLYLSHAYRNLRSPFYYKLQNNFVYLDLPDGSVKTFYREVDLFYHVLDIAINRVLHERRRAKRRLFQFIDRREISSIPLNIFQQMYPFFIDGLIFDFQAIAFEKSDWQIPVYEQTESSFKLSSDQLISKSPIGELTYHQGNGLWQFDSFVEQTSIDF